MATTKKTFSSFQDLLANSDVPLLVDFYAAWCGPCQRMKKNVWSVQDFIDFSNNLGVKRFYFDTDKFGALTSSWGVTSIPSWFVIKGGNVDSKNSYSTKAQVESVLTSTFSN